jgi:membrane peptidoglycan carboxypeptidase
MTIKTSFIRYSLISILIQFAISLSISADEFERRANPDLDFVYVKKDIDFSSYSSITIDPISVWFPIDKAPPTEKKSEAKENLSKAQTLFRKLIREELDNRHNISEAAAENTLRIHVEFIDLRSVKNAEEIPEYVATKKFKTAPGHITLVAELSDSMNGEVLARVADLGRKQSSGGSTEIDWQAIEFDLRNWARIFAAWFDKIHPHED